MVTMDKKEALEHLRNKFGFNNFKENQWEIIQRILNGEKILLIARTGFGKSLCYQFPATVFDGITLVFSPLIALMRDQVKFLRKKGIPTASINSNHSDDNEENRKINKKILEDAVNGKYKILYIAPERIDNETWKKYLPNLKISFVVVDEAHCISVWGHDFRPDYRKIREIIRAVPKSIPVLAVTATADDFIAEDIKEQMQSYIGKDIEIVRNDLFRENLRIRVIEVNGEEEKLAFLLRYLKENNNGSGIVYTASRGRAEKYSRWLRFNNINAIYYHSEIKSKDRKTIEKEFFENKYKCVVATNALGMGIDKKDIRFIIHTEFSGSLIHYYQEIGRAGRDNKPSDIILLYDEKDIEIQEYFIDQSKPEIYKYELVLISLKRKRATFDELVNETKLRKREVNNILVDLQDQRAIFKNNLDGKTYYEYNPNFKEINYAKIEEIKRYKLKKLYDFKDFVYSRKCRMNYLCNYLGNHTTRKCGACDNDTNRFISANISQQERQLLKKFYSIIHRS